MSASSESGETANQHFPPVVRVIPAAPNFSTENPQPRRRNVAAYARVSTDSAEQLNSFEAQIRYYTQHIKSNPEWNFVDIYTDADAPYGLNPNSP